MKLRTLVGLAATILWITAFAAILVSRWSESQTLKLNEWGDFVAGFAAPVALFWLVLGYLQQGEELEQNTAALMAQQVELQRQVEETRRLAEQSNRQAEAAEQLASIAREELAAERARHTAEGRVVIEYGDNHDSDDGHELEVVNKGAPARKISIERLAGGEVWFSSEEFFDTGARATFTFLYPWKFPARFAFRYLNKYDEPASQIFEMVGPGELLEVHYEAQAPARVSASPATESDHGASPLPSNDA